MEINTNKNRDKNKTLSMTAELRRKKVGGWWYP